MLNNPNYPFSFDENACKNCGGRCCTGESGFIWINDTEISALARYFGLSNDRLKNTFMIKINGRYSLIEKPYENGYACVFFDEKSKNCSIYELRPAQCKSFPFWHYFLENLDELKEQCPGICFNKASLKN